MAQLSLGKEKIKLSSVLQKVTQASRQALIYVGIFSFFVNMFMLTVPIYMLQLFDRVLASRSYDTLIFLTIMAIVALLTFGLLDIARSRVLVRVSTWLDIYLSPKALSRSADEILQGRTYGPQSLRDISSVRQFLGGPSVFTVFDSPWVPIYLVIIFFLHPILGILATLGAIALFCLALTNEMMTREPLFKANNLAINTQMHTDSAMRNAEVIQAMGMMPNIIKRWFSQNEKVLALQAEASNRSGAILSTSKFVRLTLQLLMLGTGAFLVIQNNITPGVMIAASILMARALAPVEQAIGAWKQMLNARQAFLRLNQHFATEPRASAGIDLPSPKGLLSFENVYYMPPNSQKPIIHNFSYRIDPGQLVALIGPSGAGKSTLARLMVGAWQASAGGVRLDGADIYTWDRDDFGQYIGYLPQDVELFAGSIKENIARMGDVDDEAVIKAAKLAGVHDLVLHFPEGYDTHIGPGQYNLSGGQRQRVALARALYNDPQVLVLDEPNSNLDSEGEQALSNALLHAKERGATTVIIAHRPSTVRFVDQIIVLSAGHIQFAGPRDKIMQQMQDIAKGQVQQSTGNKNA